MSKPTAVLFCPGRGSYGRESLGTIARTLQPGPVADALAASDQARRSQDRPTVSELDQAPRFRPGMHLDGENAAELIYFATMASVAQLRERYEILALAGNSLGWYTALAASNALDPASGWQLVSTMAALQKQVGGGQILTTTVGEDWTFDPGLVAATDHAIQSISSRGHDHFVARSIRLGGHEVLAGTELGIAALLEELPKVKVGEREFPFRLAGHGPFHTVLCGSTSLQAREMLGELRVRQPECNLIDGFGSVHSPWSSDPAELFDYTTGAQVVETYDFSAAIRTAMREFQPDVLLCAGPGQSLRAPVGHVVLREAWRGLRSKQALFDSDVVVTAG